MESEFSHPLTRNLHPDEFLSIMEQVEEAGGYPLTEKCVGESYRLQVPDGAGKKKWTDFHTTACNNQSRFLVPYELPAHEEDGAVAEKGYATVCAVDDGMAYWPRFQEGVLETWRSK